jgi:hypothetical protein
LQQLWWQLYPHSLRKSLQPEASPAKMWYSAPAIEVWICHSMMALAGPETLPKTPKLRNGKRISQNSSLICIQLSVGWKNYSKFKRRAAIKTEAAPKQHPNIRASMQASCFRCFDIALVGSWQIFCVPIQDKEPRAFSIRSSGSSFAAKLGIQVDAWNSIQTVSFLTERWFRESYQLRWSQRCQQCHIYLGDFVNLINHVLLIKVGVYYSDAVQAMNFAIELFFCV